MTTFAIPILGTQKMTEVTNIEPSSPPIKMTLGAANILEKEGIPLFRKREAIRSAIKPVANERIAACNGWSRNLPRAALAEPCRAMRPPTKKMKIMIRDWFILFTIEFEFGTNLWPHKRNTSL